jgi:hypothetical protein
MVRDYQDVTPQGNLTTPTRGTDNTGRGDVMTGEPQPDQPPVEPDSNPLEGVPAAEDLDALLSQASSLAAELTDDVGGPDADGELKQADDILSNTSGPADGIDTELGKMEELLDAAAAQVGTGNVSEELLAGFGEDDEATSDPASPEGEPCTDEPQDASEEAPTAAIPGFMDDLTAPEPEDSPPEPDGETPASETRPSDEVTVSDMASLQAAADALGDLGEKDLTAGTEVPDFDEPQAAEPASTTAPPSKKEPAAKLAGKNESRPLGMLAKVRRPLSAIGIVACTHGATALELIDRPFTSINSRIKMILGWIALATLATSLIVTLLF